MSNYNIFATRTDISESRRYIKIEHGDEFISLSIFDNKFSFDRERFFKEHLLTPAEARDLAKELFNRAQAVDRIKKQNANSDKMET